jgi:D-alanyl-lipoteichoic acid acyltransferase DltB (MBOAT superfamily)
MSWNAAYALLLCFTTVVTYISGLLINKNELFENRKKRVVAGSFVINIGILAYYKYFVFLITSLNKVFTSVGIEFQIRNFDILLPVGISFYVFQSLSYTMDVYRGEIEPEKNILRYALFVSFFPQLVAGPIERSKNLLTQLRTPTEFNYGNLQRGFLMMCYGYFLKLVIADNAAVVVDTVFSDLNHYQGWYIVVGAILFAFQIYGDFGGYSLIAIGAAKILGYDLMTNFNAPYFASSIAEFWRRWHISLSTWFRDYLYIPMGGNRKGEKKKWFNLMVVFLTSGLWHGAAWHYVAWGGYNGALQVLGEWFRKPRLWISNRAGIDVNSIGIRIVRIIVTFILIDLGWLIFRSESMSQFFEAILSIIHNHNSWILFDGSLYVLGLSEKQFRMLLYAVVVLLVVDLFKYKGVNLVQLVCSQHILIRNIIYVTLIMTVLILGHWGVVYDESSFLYFQF